MAQATFDGPIRSGTIRETTGTQLGVNVKNTGTVLVTQQVPFTQASGVTSIVIPANSAVHDIRVMVTSVWTGAATTFGVGVEGNPTFFTAAGATAGGAVGIVAATPGTDATRVGNFVNTGAGDKKVLVTSTNTGTGSGFIMVTYAQALNANEPTI